MLTFITRIITRDAEIHTRSYLIYREKMDGKGTGKGGRHERELPKHGRTHDKPSHSGMGKLPKQKKGGAGKANWGKAIEDATPCAAAIDKGDPNYVEDE